MVTKSIRCTGQNRSDLLGNVAAHGDNNIFFVAAGFAVDSAIGTDLNWPPGLSVLRAPLYYVRYKF